MMCKPNSIEVEQLTCSYGSFQAVKQVSFQVEKGSIFGLLGPNGAGKSSLINVLTTLKEPAAGRAAVAGFDVVKERAAVRKRIFLLMQETGADFFLNVYDNLYFYAGLQGIPRRQRKKRIDEIVEVFGLGEKKNARLDELSGGLLRRLMLTRIFLSSAEVIFLDEPTAGVDLRSRVDFWKLLRLLRSEFKVTIVIATHDLEEAESLCDTVGLLKNGELAAIDTLDNLKQLIDRVVVRVRFSQEFQPKWALKECPGLLSAKHDGPVLEFVTTSCNGQPRQALNYLDRFGSFRLLEVRQPKLADVFLSLTGEGAPSVESKECLRRVEEEAC